MNSEPLFAVYGASGCGRGIMPLAREQLQHEGRLNSSRLVFIDDAQQVEQINGHAVCTWNAFLAMPAQERFVAIAIANSDVRAKLAERLSSAGVQPWTLTALSCVRMDSVEVGEGALLCPFVTLTSNIHIGRFFHANLYSYVEHDSVIGDFVTFAPRVCCNGNVRIEDHAYIGTGAVLRQGQPGHPLVIGRGAVVGMGAVVTKDVAPGVTVVGNPARLLVKHS